MDFLNSVLLSAQNLGFIKYLIALMGALAESVPVVGLIIPGGIIVGFLGFLSAGDILELQKLILFAAAGAILGDTISYYLGTYGTKLFRLENKVLKLSYLESGKRFFKKHGNKSVFLGRFIGLLRPIVPFVAGLFEMDKKIFLFWNITSGICWAILFSLIGYFSGGALDIIETWSGRIGLFISSTIIFAVVIFYFIKYLPSFFAFLKKLLITLKNFRK